MELTIEDVAGRAGVDVAYVRRLIGLGVVAPEGDGYREQDAHVTALLHMWEEAGLTAESILAATASGQLSLDFLESPGWELPPRLDRTYRQLAEERSPLSSCGRSNDRWGSYRRSRTIRPGRTTP